MRPGDTVLVALSGGVDSVTLLHLLRDAAPTFGLRLAAAHFDHRMRDGSAADAGWVAALCAEWSVPLVSAAAAAPPASEAAAREVRYRFLRRAAAGAGAARIATAHHADDQVETILFRLARGTGVRGMRGIPARRGGVVRPLLPFRRAEIVAHARAGHLAWREDPSNGETRFARNRIRHDILPRLRALAPRIDEEVLALGREARAAQAAWDALLRRLEEGLVLAQSDGALELARPLLLSYHPHVRTRLVRRALLRLGSVPGRSGTRAAMAFINSASSGTMLRVAGGCVLEREFDRLRIRRADVADEPAPSGRTLCIAGPAGEGTARLVDRALHVRWSLAAGPCGGDVAIAAAAVRFPLLLRGWRAGDRLVLPCGTKKLKKLFVERRVGRRARVRRAVLADGGGDILWVEGIAQRRDTEPGPAEPALHLTITDA